MPLSEDYGTLSPYSPLYQPSYAELARNRMAAASDRPGYTHLGNSLGAMFFGGPARDARYEDIYNKSAKDQVSLEDLVMKARKERDAQIGRDGAVQRALDSGHPEIADWIRNSPNAASSLEAQLHGQALDFGQKAWDTATGPNANTDASLELLARMEAVRGHNMDLTKIDGGLEFTPQRTPADQSSQLETPGGVASRKHSEALTSEADARTAYITGPQTRESRARTAKDMRTGAGGAPKYMNKGQIQANFPDSGGGTDTAAYTDYQRWLYNNGLSDELGSLPMYRDFQSKQPKPPPAPAAPVAEDKPWYSSLGDLFSQRTKDAFAGIGGDLRKAVSPPGNFVGDSPHPEGTRLIKDGKRYTVKNGVPVPDPDFRLPARQTPPNTQVGPQ